MKAIMNVFLNIFNYKIIFSTILYIIFIQYYVWHTLKKYCFLIFIKFI